MSTTPQKIAVGEIRSSYAGFARLAEIATALKPYAFDTIETDFSTCSWFDANMSAPLGVVFAHVTNDLNDIKPTGFLPRVESILSKNHFLEGYGFQARNDTYATTIPFHRFGLTDDRSFADYLKKHLRGKSLPTMSEALSKRFQNSILEVFVNAAGHSESELGIFACGQFFPKRNQVDFCVADAGIGFRRKIKKELGLRMNSDKAIEWALQEGHTTKKGKVPGGLGLKLIQEFIAKNKGRIQIVSDRGYWEWSSSGENLKRFEHPFPGTVINIEINTSDSSSYRLSSELND